MSSIIVNSLACSGGGEEITQTSPQPTVAVPIPASQSLQGVIQVVNRDPGGSGKYEFSPSEFVFTVGERVTFQVRAESEFHTFNVDNLGIDKSIDAGETIEFTHIFDKPGNYKLYCIPHEALGMVGTILVQ